MKEREGNLTRSLSRNKLTRISNAFTLMNIDLVSPGVLEIVLPSCKTTRLMEYRQIVVGDDFVVLMKWIIHRKQIFRENPYLFITSTGTKITCDSITRMLSDLSVAAGYGRGFGPVL